MNIHAKINFTVSCVLSEGELRALDALVGYGFKPFIEAFYEKMGRAYMEPYEQDMKALFEKVAQLRPEIHKINEMRKSINDL